MVSTCYRPSLIKHINTVACSALGPTTVGLLTKPAVKTLFLRQKLQGFIPAQRQHCTLLKRQNMRSD